MLTADLVRVRRRGDVIEVRPLSKMQRSRLLDVGATLLAITSRHLDCTQGNLDSAWDDVPIEPTDYKLVKGMRKLLKDRCTFDQALDVDPLDLRRLLFTKAAEIRRNLDDHEVWDPRSVLELFPEINPGVSGSTGEVLFADLRENHILKSFIPIDAAGLVAAYERAQLQAILLRAVRVLVVFSDIEAPSVRRFFNLLKFRRLLYSIFRTDEGSIQVEIDGPLSLFRSVTKYGLSLALLLPALEECGQWRLEADVQWGKGRETSRFTLSGESRGTKGMEGYPLADEVEAFRKSFLSKKSQWVLEVAHELLDLPGSGLCVPDLVFHHPRQKLPVYLEILGFWSRAAVWRRVELVQSGLPYNIIFAVSSRLRVSEEVLDENLPGRLYTYKGVIVASEILSRLEQFLELGDVTDGFS